MPQEKKAEIGCSLFRFHQHRGPRNEGLAIKNQWSLPSSTDKFTTTETPYSSCYDRRYRMGPKQKEKAEGKGKGKAQEEEEAEVCIICLDELNAAEEEYIELNCPSGIHHRYHSYCFTAWRGSRGTSNITCPICRAQVFEQSTINPENPKVNYVEFPCVVCFDYIMDEDAHMTLKCPGTHRFHPWCFIDYKMAYPKRTGKLPCPICHGERVGHTTSNYNPRGSSDDPPRGLSAAWKNKQRLRRAVARRGYTFSYGPSPDDETDDPQDNDTNNANVAASNAWRDAMFPSRARRSGSGTTPSGSSGTRRLLGIDEQDDTGDDLDSDHLSPAGKEQSRLTDPSARLSLGPSSGPSGRPQHGGPPGPQYRDPSSERRHDFTRPSSSSQSAAAPETYIPTGYPSSSGTTGRRDRRDDGNMASDDDTKIGEPLTRVSRAGSGNRSSQPLPYSPDVYQPSGTLPGPYHPPPLGLRAIPRIPRPGSVDPFSRSLRTGSWPPRSPRGESPPRLVRRGSPSRPVRDGSPIRRTSPSRRPGKAIRKGTSRGVTIQSPHPGVALVPPHKQGVSSALSQPSQGGITHSTAQGIQPPGQGLHSQTVQPNHPQDLAEQARQRLHRRNILRRARDNLAKSARKRLEKFRDQYKR
jgi:hypothetical protein